VVDEDTIQREFCLRQLSSMQQLCRRFYAAGQTQTALSAAQVDRDNFASAVRYAAEHLVENDDDDEGWWSLATIAQVTFLDEFLPGDAFRALFDALAAVTHGQDDPKLVNRSTAILGAAADGDAEAGKGLTEFLPDDGFWALFGALGGLAPGKAYPKLVNRRCRALSAAAYGAARQGRGERAAVQAAAAYDLLSWVSEDTQAFCLYCLAVVCRSTDPGKAATLARRALELYRGLEQPCAWSPPERIRRGSMHDLKSRPPPPRMGVKAFQDRSSFEEPTDKVVQAGSPFQNCIHNTPKEKSAYKALKDNLFFEDCAYVVVQARSSFEESDDKVVQGCSPFLNCKYNIQKGSYEEIGAYRALKSHPSFEECTYKAVQDRSSFEDSALKEDHAFKVVQGGPTFQDYTSNTPKGSYLETSACKEHSFFDDCALKVVQGRFSLQDNSMHDLKPGCTSLRVRMGIIYSAELLASILADSGSIQMALSACRMSDEAGFQALDPGHPGTVSGYLVRRRLWASVGLMERARQAAVRAAEAAVIYYAEEHPATGEALACLCESRSHRGAVDESICDAIHALAVRIKVSSRVLI